MRAALRLRGALLVVAAPALLAALAPAGLRAQSGGNDLLYVGTYDRAIYVLDEATGKRIDQIPVESGTPHLMDINRDKTRFHIVDMTYEQVETIDIPSKTTVDKFTLSKGNETVRIYSQAIAPDESYAVFLAKSYKKLRDRFQVSDPMLLRVDLKTHQVTDTIPWPIPPQDRDQFMFSPDGSLLYFFGDDMVALETKGFTEAQRWHYTRVLDDGMGDFSFRFQHQPYDPEGIYTDLFTVRDPVQDRRLMGIARVDLANRKVDFATVGPADGVQFSLAPGGHRGYGIHSETGDYQFWTFDVDNDRVIKRGPFQGRPRMRLLVSSNGKLLYVYQAGQTIDVYDADTYEHLKTIELNADTTTELFVLPRR